MSSLVASSDVSDELDRLCVGSSSSDSKKKKSIHDVNESEVLLEFLKKNPEIDAQELRQRQYLYDAVFSSFPVHYGKQVSRLARDLQKFRSSSLVYGEISYASFFATLKKVEGAKGTFYDLGSGAGKPCIAAATMGLFDRCVGLEFLKDLVDASLEAKIKFETVLKDRPKIRDAFFAEKECNIDFLEADITDFNVYDWSDGDVVFANSTCFDDNLMDAIANKAKHLRKNATFITFTKKLPSPHFQVTDTKLYHMSWGGATVFIQTKINDPVDVEEDDDDRTPVSKGWLQAAHHHNNDDDGSP